MIIEELHNYRGDLMLFTVRDCQIYYEKQGNHSQAVILMHGWGQNTSMMKPIADHLQHHFTVYNIDFPGFGRSDTPQSPWGVEEYTMMLRQFVESLNIEKPILICHSFGARVGILYASKYPVLKMVITGGAGIRPKQTLGYHIKVLSYKLTKKILKVLHQKSLLEYLQQHSGSDDYRQLNGVMRASFSKIVNLDLTDKLAEIKADVLLVWGELDQATPLWMGKVMAEKIPNAGLAVFEGDDHYAYWHQMPRFLAVIDIFLKEDGMNYDC